MEFFDDINEEMTVRRHSSRTMLIHVDKIDTTIDEQISECPTCSVCLNDVKKNAIKLKCGHLFHESCAKEWLK